MPNLLAKAIRQHHAALAKAGGVVAAVSLDGADVSLTVIPLSATVDPTSIGEGIASERLAEWGVAADELIINSAKREPQHGMAITVAAQDGIGPDTAGVYAVVNGPGGRPFEVMDALGLLYRVFTVFKGPAHE